MRRASPLLCAALLAAACAEQARTSAPPAIGESRDLALIASGELSPGAPLGSEIRQLAVSAGRSGWLVVWSRPSLLGEDLVGLRVSPSGAPLDAAPFVISAAAGDEQSPAVAFDGAQWLVVWQDHRVGPLMNIYAARVKEDGTVLDPAGIPVNTQEDHQRSPSVAVVDGTFIVVWEDRRAQTEWDVWGARVAADGTVLDPVGFVVSSAAGHQLNPAVAAGGGVALAAWQDPRSDVSIYGARITSAGAVLDPLGFPVANGPGVETNPSAAFHGGTFTVAFQDRRGAVEPDVRAARVTPEGQALDPAGLAVAAGPLGELAPALTDDGRHLVVAWAAGTAGVAAQLEGIRLDAAGVVQDVPAFGIASGALGRSLAIAADAEGRALVVHDALDGLGGVTLRGRVLTSWARLDVAKAGRGAGVVASTPAGLDCGLACSARFDGGAAVTLVATPDADSAFGGWSGACSGQDACTVTMDQARSVTATFLPLLSVELTITGSGAVSSSPGGLACPGTCSARFPEGTQVQLLPQGTTGASVFSEWSEDCSGTGACALVVDAPKRVTAAFVAAKTLTLAPSGTSPGALSGLGLTCSSGQCRVDVAVGANVTITGVPAETSVLKTWTGCTTYSGADCSVTVQTARSITARFEPKTLQLRASAAGVSGGAGHIGGAGLACATGATEGCTAAVPNPPFTPGYETVTLRATGLPASVFKSWSGCTAVIGDPSACTLLVNAAKVVSGRFEPSTWPLRATLTGTGSGAVIGAGLDCTAGSATGCTAAVPNPADSSAYDTVVVRAVPAPGSVFKSWTGCTPVEGDPAACSVVMSGSKSVSARFEPASFALRASLTGPGAGLVSGAGLACATGSADGCLADVGNPPNVASYATVTLRAAAQPGSVFKTWTSCTAVPPGDLKACTLLVNSAKTVIARFEAEAFPLHVGFTGAGAGRVTGPGLACEPGATAGCDTTVVNPEGVSTYTTVTLRAEPFAGSAFKSWTGCTAVAGDPSACTVAVSAARSVTAKFEPDSFPLAVTTTGPGAGTVTGAGLSCQTGSTAGCTVAVENPTGTVSYTTVTLSAAAAPGSVFKSWTGCVALPAAPAQCTVAVSSAKSVQARFEPDAYGVSVRATGGGAGLLTGPGIECRVGAEACTFTVANPADSAAYATPTLSVAPDAGYVVRSWTGCVPLPDPTTCSLRVDGTESVTVRIEPATFRLTTTVSGSGAVAGGPIACTAGATSGCAADVPNGDALTLVATPGPGMILKSWTGCVANADGSCTVTMTSAKSVTATFQPATFPLTLSFVGTGAGSVAAGGTACASTGGGCTLDLANGAVVSLVPTPDAGSRFVGWLGACWGSGECVVTMSTARSVQARFESP